jgi:hypothetical protein
MVYQIDQLFRLFFGGRGFVRKDSDFQQAPKNYSGCETPLPRAAFALLHPSFEDGLIVHVGNQFQIAFLF